jgi:biopolymer transport protein ExbD
MSEQSTSTSFENPLDQLLKRKPLRDDGHFDITAMIDLVFMMNIFFLVTWVGQSMNEMSLPTAQHCVAVDADAAVMFTVVPDYEGDSVTLYVGEDAKNAITDPEGQDQAIRVAVEEGLVDGKTSVVFKAEKKVRLRQMARLTSAAAAEGMQLHLGVIEKD